MSFKSGFIAIIGRPNTGKSTLLNKVLGEKVAIVSARPQTTRNAIRGVHNMDDAQMVFIDTPGIHRLTGLLNEFMIREALNAVPDVDCVLLVVDSSRRPSGDERLIIENLQSVKSPVVLVLNKIDAASKESLLPLIREYSKLFKFTETVPVSALTGEGLPNLIAILKGILPEGPSYFPDDILTDELERTIAGEIIREKVFRLTKQEIPYSVAVEIEEFVEKKKLISIKAAINVERDSQKGIVIGKRGVMLKKIGTSAREDIEKLLNTKVYLELFVKVTKDWTKNKRALKEFGYTH